MGDVLKIGEDEDSERDDSELTDQRSRNRPGSREGVDAARDQFGNQQVEPVTGDRQADNGGDERAVRGQEGGEFGACRKVSTLKATALASDTSPLVSHTAGGPDRLQW